MELWIRATIFTVIIIVSTALLLGIKGKRDFLSYNAFIAFIISFFVEMYGLVFTFYIIDSQIHGMYVQNVGIYVGNTLLAVGMIIVAVGWYQIYKGKGKLVTSGLYRYSRHPQYLGLIIFCIGWQIQYPLLISFCIFLSIPILYYFLARYEEKFLIKQYGQQYIEYQERTRMFL